MGFNHCYIPSIKDLTEQFERKGLEEFVKSYRKYEGITGPSESIFFLEEKIKEYETVTNNNNNNININGM